MGYLSNFIVYMLAMVGVMMLALFIFKQSTGCKISGNHGKCLKVLDTLSLGGRKTLYIVSAGEEKFLIAGDVDRTSLISKLNSNKNNTDEESISAIMTMEKEDFSTKSFKETMVSIPKRQNFMDKMEVGIKSTQKSPYDSVMKSLAEKIKG